MNDDYLWDRSGEPDPEVERLERLLGRYKHDAPLQVAPFRRRRWTRLALAAALLLVVLGLGFFAVRFHWRSGAPWDIEQVAGMVTIDGDAISQRGRFGVGDTLVTGPGSRVKVQVARVGELEIGPGSELELTATSRNRHRLNLRRGTLHARIWAPPFVFAVRTPAGLASDIGCAFTLQYEGERGLLKVTSGWVDFDGDTRSALVPRGATSELDRDLGPGTPYWNDAPVPLVEALRTFDKHGRTADLHRVLAAARPRDAMTVLHLLERARREHRGPLFDRLSQLAPPPSGVTRDGVLDRDLRMINAWREKLGLGGVKKWWMQWRDALPD